VAGSAEGLEWAARNHVGLVVQGTVPQANEIFDYYQGYAEQQCGWQPSAGSRAVYRDLYIAPTMAEIRREYQDTILPLYLASNEHETHNQAIPKIAELRREQYTERSYAYQAVRKASLDQRVRRTIEDVHRDGDWLVGDPDAVTEQILRQRKECNADVLVIRPEMGTLSFEEIERQLELFAKEVLPALKKA
ncbi:MAG: class flavin-dependent oxidoreductase, partial [Chloroflexi bacterium]|nr:class flavin-dependent oxidoreductase [Chloroflexota bacterium]